MIDASCWGAAEVERALTDGSVLLPMFYVAGVVTDVNGDEYVAPFSPLMHSAKEALVLAEELNKTHDDRLEVLHVPRRARPSIEREAEWLEKHRLLAAEARARNSQ